MYANAECLRLKVKHLRRFSIHWKVMEVVCVHACLVLLMFLLSNMLLDPCISAMPSCVVRMSENSSFIIFYHSMLLIFSASPTPLLILVSQSFTYHWFTFIRFYKVLQKLVSQSVYIALLSFIFIKFYKC